MRILERTFIDELAAFGFKDGEVGGGVGACVRGLKAALVNGTDFDLSSSARLRGVVEKDRRHLVGSL